MANKNLTLNLSLNAKSLSKTFADLAKDVQDIIGSTAKWKDALKGVNKELTASRKDIAKIAAQSTPEAVRKRVALQLQREDAQEELKKREAGERARQYDPKTFAGKLGKALGFDVSKGNAGTQTGLGAFAKKLGFGDEAAGLIGGVSKALGPLAVAATLGTVALKKLGSTIQEFVGIANPGAMKRFNYAVQDAYAVIGHSLTPVIEIWTKGVRLLGDFLAGILPSAKEVRNLLGDFDKEFKDLRQSLADIAPVIKLLVVETIKLGAMFTKVWLALNPGIGVLKSFSQVMEALGLGGGKLPDSTGAAARSAKFQDPEAAAKEFYQAIFSQQGKDPARETAANTKGIWDSIKELPQIIAEKLGNVLSGIFEKLPTSIQSALMSVAEAILNPLDTLSSIFSGVGDAIANLPTIFTDALGNAFASLTDIFANLPLRIGDTLSSLGTDLASSIQNIPESIARSFANLPQQIGEAIRNALPVPSVGSASGAVAGAAAAVPGVNVAVSAYEAARRWITGE